MKPRLPQPLPLCAASACPVRCSRGRTTVPTPAAGARTLSRGRRLCPSSRARSSGTRPSPRRRRPRSPARPPPSCPPVPKGRVHLPQRGVHVCFCLQGSVRRERAALALALAFQVRSVMFHISQTLKLMMKTVNCCK